MAPLTQNGDSLRADEADDADLHGLSFLVDDRRPFNFNRAYEISYNASSLILPDGTLRTTAVELERFDGSDAPPTVDLPSWFSRKIFLNIPTGQTALIL